MLSSWNFSHWANGGAWEIQMGNDMAGFSKNPWLQYRGREGGRREWFCKGVRVWLLHDAVSKVHFILVRKHRIESSVSCGRGREKVSSRILMHCLGDVFKASADKLEGELGIPFYMEHVEGGCLWDLWRFPTENYWNSREESGAWDKDLEVTVAWVMFKATSMAELGSWRLTGPRVSGTNNTSLPKLQATICFWCWNRSPCILKSENSLV